MFLCSGWCTLGSTLVSKVQKIWQRWLISFLKNPVDLFKTAVYVSCFQGFIINPYHCQSLLLGCAWCWSIPEMKESGLCSKLLWNKMLKFHIWSFRKGSKYGWAKWNKELQSVYHKRNKENTKACGYRRHCIILCCIMLNCITLCYMWMSIMMRCTQFFFEISHFGHTLFKPFLMIQT